MRVTSILSLILYPILNSLIESLGYKHPSWGIFSYFMSELIKFFFPYLAPPISGFVKLSSGLGGLLAILLLTELAGILFVLGD